jgi:acetyl esterase/lipase
LKHLPNISYSKDFQEKRNLDLYLPEDTNKKGIIVFIHGGNWQNGDKKDWQEVAEYFCQNGFLTASINYRLAPQWNLPAQLEDVRLAIAYIKKKAASLGYSPQKLTICGSAAGAYLALMMAVIQPNEYLGKSNELLDEKTHPKAVIAFYPIVSLNRGYHSAIIDKTIKALLSFDPSKEQESFIKDCSPSERPEDFNCPLLILHNEKNAEIPIESIRKFQKELISCQVAVKLITSIEDIATIEKISLIKANPEVMRTIENFLKEFLL